MITNNHFLGKAVLMRWKLNRLWREEECRLRSLCSKSIRNWTILPFPKQPQPIQTNQLDLVSNRS